MPKKDNHNADEYRMFTVRLERETVQRLTRLAGERQAAQGRNVTVSDLVRRALENYLKDNEK